MLGPNATSRKNEMTSGTFGVVSLAQQLPSKPKTQGWLRIYIWTDCKRRLTFAFVEINHDSSRLQTGPLEGLKIWGENSFVCLIVEINHDLSRLQAGQGRRKVWKSEGYILSFLRLKSRYCICTNLGEGSITPLSPLFRRALQEHTRASLTEQLASLAWHHAHSGWCGDVHHDRIATDKCQVKNVTRALTSINKINQLWV